MKLALIAIGCVALLITLALWLMTKIHYRIGSRHLKILCLGVPVRKIELTDIKRISKRKPSRMAEYWSSTLNPSHRLLAIQRYSGLRKFVVITPRNRYIFLADLQNAIKRVKPDANIDALMEGGTGEADAESAPSAAAVSSS